MEQINKVFSITGKEIVTQEKKTLNQKSNQFKVSQQGIFHRNSLRFTRQLYIICQLAHHLYVFISAFLHVYRCRHQIYSALFFHFFVRLETNSFRIDVKKRERKKTLVTSKCD